MVKAKTHVDWPLRGLSCGTPGLSLRKCIHCIHKCVPFASSSKAQPPQIWTRSCLDALILSRCLDLLRRSPMHNGTVAIYMPCWLCLLHINLEGFCVITHDVHLEDNKVNDLASSANQSGSRSGWSVVVQESPQSRCQ